MRVCIVIDSVPGYRRGLYERLLANDEIELTVYCQSAVRGFNLQLIHKELGDRFIEVPFISTSGHTVAWQKLPIRRMWQDFDVYFFLGNPRILSTVVWATLFRLFGKKVVIWGQAHTAGSNPTTEAIRLAWWRIFKDFLVYTDSDVVYLRDRGFGRHRMTGMNNGLDQDVLESVKRLWTTEKLSQWRNEQHLNGKKVILSCARLIQKNRFDLVLRSMPDLLRAHPNLVWCVIGNGNQREQLASLAERYEVSNNVVWVGELYDEAELAPWFLSSEFLVHPGAIGLTLMHAFGYGLPVITHDNAEFHMPEIAAFENGLNGLQFEQNNDQNLQSVIASLLDDPQKQQEMSRAALETVQTKFNTAIMADRFISAARTALADQ